MRGDNTLRHSKVFVFKYSFELNVSTNVHFKSSSGASSYEDLYPVTSKNLSIFVVKFEGIYWS